MTSLKHTLASVGSHVLDMAFPPRCPSCEASVAADGNFCPGCFNQLKLITPPLCNCCGIPFAADMGADALCPECLTTPPAFTSARAVMVYDRISAPLVSALKFHDQWAGLSRYGAMMKSSGGELLAKSDLIIPVPLHWHRLLKRRYNQAALLAYRLAEESGLLCRMDILKRAQATSPQMRLHRDERLTNVKRAFVLGSRADAVNDKTVLLVDDVVTTGATVNACAALLLKAGAKEVNVLALARTVKE